MSNACQPDYPDELKPGVWEKDKKSGFDAKSDVADKLKALQKKHDGVAWKLFDDGWTKSAKTAEELEKEGEKRDKVYGGEVMALKKDALAIAKLAQAEEKKVPKDNKALTTTLKAIGEAAGDYAQAIDKGKDALVDVYDKAQDELPEEDDEDSTPAALVDPKLLGKQLNMCKKDPDLTMKFAFVDAKGNDQPAMMALNRRMSARGLFKKLQAAAGVKTGAYGSAWVDGTILMLQLDKPLSGLVKKVRQPVRASGFRISKAVLYNADGSEFESDDTPDEAIGNDPAAPGAEAGKSSAPPAPPKPSVTYEAKLATLKPRIHKAAAEGSPDVPKHDKLLEFATTKAKAEDFLGAVAALRQIEQLLDNPTPKTTAPGGVDPAAAFNARFAALLPKIKTAELEIKAIASEAGIIAKNQKDYDKAGKMLDEVEALLGQQDGSGQQPTPRQTASGRSESGFSKVAFESIHLDWESGKKATAARLKQLNQAIVDDGDGAEFVTAAAKLDKVLARLNKGLSKTLDAMRNSADGPQRVQLSRQARDIADRYLDYLATDELVVHVDDNPYEVKVDARGTLSSPLQRLRAQLDALDAQP